MPNGALRVYASVAEQAAPLAGVSVAVLDESGAVLARLTTDASGAAGPLPLTAPDASYSLDENNRTVRPYAIYRLVAEATGWQSQILDGVQIFAGQETVARLSFLPAAPADAPTLADTRTEEQNVEVTTIPPHVLFAGGGGSGPTPEENLNARVLTEVVIPKKITVHLGKPSANVSNVTVGFQEYIANVASSEVYPTWPEEALRANILAQISLALNRIWTEWYPSRGYAFNITGSPGYDQAYVAGRTVFAVMERLTAELFNTYVRRSGDQEPYFTEYCDGKLVTCPGMKQWGTVDRANEGKNALQILRYYYGDRVQLVTTNNIASIPSSWPGIVLRRGDTGMEVRLVQFWLRLAADNYTSLAAVSVDGNFGAATEKAVTAFQSLFGLTTDGIVGRATWNKLNEVALAVVNEIVDANVAPGQFTTTVREGSRGTAVRAVQYYLRRLSAYYSDIPSVAVDGIFGAATTKSVKAWQSRAGLTVDGVVGRQTWNSLYEAVQSLATSGPVVRTASLPAPASTLQVGDSGAAVLRLDRLLLFLGQWLPEINFLGSTSPSSTFTQDLELTVRSAQRYFGLPETGEVTTADWNAFLKAAQALAEVNPAAAAPEPDGVWPASALTLGSSGPAVLQVQRWLNLIASVDQGYLFVPETGELDAATQDALENYQLTAGLPTLGVVDAATWESLRTAAQALCSTCQSNKEG